MYIINHQLCFSSLFSMEVSKGRIRKNGNFLKHLQWRGGGGSGLHLSFFSSLIVDVDVADEGNDAVDVAVVVNDNGVT